MAVGKNFGWGLTIGIALFGAAMAGVVAPLGREGRNRPRRGARGDLHQGHRADPAAQLPELPSARPGGADVAPHLRGRAAVGALDEARTAIRDKAGAMPPWYIEKNIGIQHYKNDPSLSDEEVAKIAKWADTGAPRGNMADMPAPRVFPDGASWHAGEPDLIVESPEITVKANAPDWWGEFEPTKIPITEDRYVASVEIREVNNFSQRVGPRRPWASATCGTT